jgi:hypothetical protein
MNCSMTKDTAVWEDEGGAAPEPPGVSAASMIGTAAQVEWVGRVKRQVGGRVRPTGEVIPIDRWKTRRRQAYSDKEPLPRAQEQSGATTTSVPDGD